MPPIGARSLSEGGTAFPPRAPMGEGGSGSPLGHPPIQMCLLRRHEVACADGGLAAATHRGEGGVCMGDFMSTMRGAGSARPCENEGAPHAACRAGKVAAAGLEPATFGL